MKYNVIIRNGTEVYDKMQGDNLNRLLYFIRSHKHTFPLSVSIELVNQNKHTFPLSVSIELVNQNKYKFYTLKSGKLYE